MEKIVEFKAERIVLSKLPEATGNSGQVGNRISDFEEIRREKLVKAAMDRIKLKASTIVW